MDEEENEDRNLIRDEGRNEGQNDQNRQGLSFASCEKFFVHTEVRDSVRLCLGHIGREGDAPWESQDPALFVHPFPDPSCSLQEAFRTDKDETDKPSHGSCDEGREGQEHEVVVAQQGRRGESGQPRPSERIEKLDCDDLDELQCREYAEYTRGVLSKGRSVDLKDRRPVSCKEIKAGSPRQQKFRARKKRTSDPHPQLGISEPAEKE